MANITASSRTGGGGTRYFTERNGQYFDTDPSFSKFGAQISDPRTIEAIKSYQGGVAGQDYNVQSVERQLFDNGAKFYVEDYQKAIANSGRPDLDAQRYLGTATTPTGQPLGILPSTSGVGPITQQEYQKSATETIEQYNLRIAKRRAEIQAQADQLGAPTPSPRETLSRGITDISGLKSSFGKAPEAPSAIETYKTLRSEQGVGDTENQLQTVNENLRALQDEIASGARKIKGELVSSTVIGRKLVQLDAETKDALQELQTERANLIDSINTKNQTINQMVQMTQWDYTQARQIYNDEYSHSIQLMNLLNQEEDRNRNDAIANFNAFTKLLENNPGAFQNITPEQSVYFQSLDTKMGMPLGFSETFFQSDPGAKQLSISSLGDGRFSVLKQDPSGALSTVIVGTKVSGTGDNKPPASYQEWQLAGGEKGTGKTYAEWVAPKDSITDVALKQFINKQIASPEFDKLSDDDKALYIRSQGGDPNDFTY